MIEAIVDYIRQKGYEVRVRSAGKFLPVCLIMNKEVTIQGEPRIYRYDWAIDDIDLNQIPKEWFLQQADRHLAKIEEAIAQECL